MADAMEKVADSLIKGLKQYFKEHKFIRAVVGLSGGIDSSLTATIAAKALGKKNVFGLIMPEVGVSSQDSLKFAKKVVRKLKIDYATCPINQYLKPYKLLRWDQNKLALINTKARIRANLLYNYANTHNAIVLGTSNKSELLLGYFTKYGDGAVDIEPIGELWKTEVIRLAAHLKVPQDIINRPPTAELYHGHTDEEELGGPYSEIDVILKMIEKKKKASEIVKQGVDKKLVERITKMVERNRHKTQLPPTISKAFKK